MRSRTAPITAPSRHRAWPSARLRSIAAIALAAAAALAVAIPATSGASPLAQKQAEAAAIGAQVDKLNQDFDHLQELYRGAAYKLQQIDTATKKLDADLAHTQQQLGVAQQRLVERVLVIYRQGGADSELVSLARAGSFDQLFRRFDAIKRISGQDASILKDIRDLRAKESAQHDQLKQARVDQAHAVALRKSAKQQMAKRLAQRQAVLGSVNSEIRGMVAAQQAQAAAAAAAAAKRSAVGVKIPAPGQPNTPDNSVAPSSAPDAGTAIAPPVTPAPPASSNASGAASVAMRYIGVKYVWGGASPSGFDCSGLVMYSFGQVGISLPHSSYAQWGAGPHVSRDQLEVGDLVFFDGGGHVGIYVGGGSYVHAPHSGSSVRVDSLNDSWSSSHYSGATRVL